MFGGMFALNSKVKKDDYIFQKTYILYAQVTRSHFVIICHFAEDITSNKAYNLKDSWASSSKKTLNI